MDPNVDSRACSNWEVACGFVHDLAATTIFAQPWRINAAQHDLIPRLEQRIRYTAARTIAMLSRLRIVYRDLTSLDGLGWPPIIG